jgi:hypothetical protein
VSLNKRLAELEDVEREREKRRLGRIEQSAVDWLESGAVPFDSDDMTEMVLAIEAAFLVCDAAASDPDNKLLAWDGSHPMPHLLYVAQQFHATGFRWQYHLLT